MLEPLYTYTEQHTVEPDEADPNRLLRLSSLFTLLQRTAQHHTEVLGIGFSTMLKQGFLWVIVHQRADIRRMPEIGERLRIHTCPGESLHMLFPRYYEITTEEGDVLITSTSLWTLIHTDTRKMAFSGEHRISVPGCPNDRRLLSTIRTPVCKPTESFSYTAQYCDMDFNGHMNNTRYFEMAENRIPGLTGLEVREVSVEYDSEILLGETVTVGWSCEEDTYLLSGERDGKRKFSLMLRGVQKTQ